MYKWVGAPLLGHFIYGCWKQQFSQVTKYLFLQTCETLKSFLHSWAYKHGQWAVFGSWDLVWPSLLCSKVVERANSWADCLGSFPDDSICQGCTHTSRPKKIYFDPVLFSYLSVPLFLVKLLRTIIYTPSPGQTVFYKNDFDILPASDALPESCPTLNPSKRWYWGSLPLKLGRPLWVLQLIEPYRRDARRLRSWVVKGKTASAFLSGCTCLRTLELPHKEGCDDCYFLLEAFVGFLRSGSGPRQRKKAVPCTWCAWSIRHTGPRIGSFGQWYVQTAFPGRL